MKDIDETRNFGFRGGQVMVIKTKIPHKQEHTRVHARSRTQVYVCVLIISNQSFAIIMHL